jgi:hypothetical protein
LNTKLGRAFTSVELIPDGSLARSNWGGKYRKRYRRTKTKVASTIDTPMSEMKETAITDHATFSNAGII